MDIKLKIRTGKFIETVPATLIVSDNKSRIFFPYHQAAIEEIKQLKGRQFIDATGGGPCWEFPTGTMARASWLHKRNYFGIDISSEYITQAKDRIKNEHWDRFPQD